MMTKLLTFGLIAALANIAGGYWLTSRRRISPQLLARLVGLGAGFMLAAVFLEVVPAAIELGRWHNQVEIPMGLILGGYLLLQFFEHTVVPHFHLGEETHSDALLNSRVMVAAVSGLAMHTFFDGVSIAAGFLVDLKLGLLIFIAIVLHKIPDGVTVASIVLASGRSKRLAQYATLFVGGATLAGVVMVAIIQGSVSYALPLSAGVTLYVAASDLIPEVNKEGVFISFVVFAGVALFSLTDRLIEGLGL
ncbi:MAG: ZIP family metal transporter [Acidobacteria bacterium]|nr:ZIP family metal transporter [Acidobacteriota bacterium]